MNRKGYFTGRKIKLRDGVFTIGNIVGYKATGVPIYSTYKNNVRVGEIGNDFIHNAKKRKELWS